MISSVIIQIPHLFFPHLDNSLSRRVIRSWCQKICICLGDIPFLRLLWTNIYGTFWNLSFWKTKKTLLAVRATCDNLKLQIRIVLEQSWTRTFTRDIWKSGISRALVGKTYISVHRSVIVDNNWIWCWGIDFNFCWSMHIHPLSCPPNPSISLQCTCTVNFGDLDIFVCNTRSTTKGQL